MGKIRTAIHEIVVYVRSMSESERNAFRQFIGPGKSNQPVNLLLKALERTDPNKAPIGIVKRLVTMPNGADYKTFERFRKKLFEFEITSRRLGYYKTDDHRTYLLIYLKKEILASQIIIEKNATETSIQILSDSFRKSMRFELVHHAAECARFLSKYHGYGGDIKMRDQWGRTFSRLENLNYLFEAISDEYEQISFRTYCCHDHGCKLDQKVLSDFKMKSKHLKLMNTRWMNRAVSLMLEKKSMKPRDFILKAIQLHKELKNDPGVYPLQFALSIYQIILEFFFEQGRIHLIKRSVPNIIYITRLTVYQSIPVLRFYLCFMIKHHRSGYLAICIARINTIDIYHRFPEFMGFVRRIEMLMLIQQGKFQEALQARNRKTGADPDCKLVELELRLLEIIALVNIRELVLASDKFENLRKFRSNIPTDDFSGYVTLFTLLKDGLSDRRDCDNNVSEVVEISVYDLRLLIANEIIQAFPRSYNARPVMVSHREYRLNETELMQVAEEARKWEIDINQFQ